MMRGGRSVFDRALMLLLVLGRISSDPEEHKYYNTDEDLVRRSMILSIIEQEKLH